MKKIIFIIAVLINALSAVAQPPYNNTLFSPVTTKQAREERYKYLIDTTIRQYLREPLNDDNEGLWNDALWSLELLQYKDAFTKTKMTEAWNKAGNLSEYFQKNLLETTYSLYTTEFRKQVMQLMQNSNSVAVFIRSAEYVLRADSGRSKLLIASLIKSKFQNDRSIGLQILKSRLDNIHKPIELPPLKDIVDKDFLKGKTVIYSFQRSNRAYAGVVVIRKPDGSWLMNENGTIFQTAQLARAITAYPFYITNGHTPQGIYRWTGFGNSRLLYIGPTTNLQMVMPNETTPSVFFADSSLANTSWQKSIYASMLPETWKNYEGIYESFYAGAMGRYDIIMHGTTIDPSFYKGQTYYPQTPSLGCLCSAEEWDNRGNRVKSNQQEITDALDTIEASEGYVVVIDIDDAKRPVSIGDIKEYLTH